MADDRRTIVMLDGRHRDEPAIAEATSSTGGSGADLVILLVPAVVQDWAHLELGEDPNLLRVQIEREQRRLTAKMLDAAGIDDGYLMEHMRSRWRIGERSLHLEGCKELIVSTSSRLVRRRATRLARRNRIPLRLARRGSP